MTKAEIIALLDEEYERCLKMLPQEHPYNDIYHDILRTAERLHFLKCCEGDELETAEFKSAVETAFVPQVAIAEEGVGDNLETATVTTTESVDWVTYRLDLRGALADARSAGVNTSELIRKYGVAKYTDIPDDCLPSLREDMEAALKEMG